jgi:hypothetical protein
MLTIRTGAPNTRSKVGTPSSNSSRGTVSPAPSSEGQQIPGVTGSKSVPSKPRWVIAKIEWHPGRGGHSTALPAITLIKTGRWGAAGFSGLAMAVLGRLWRFGWHVDNLRVGRCARRTGLCRVFRSRPCGAKASLCLAWVAHHRRIWDEKELARIVAARRGGLTVAEIAARFQCSGATILKQLRARGAPSG